MRRSGAISSSPDCNPRCKSITAKSGRLLRARGRAPSRLTATSNSNPPYGAIAATFARRADHPPRSGRIAPGEHRDMNMHSVLPSRSRRLPCVSAWQSPPLNSRTCIAARHKACLGIVVVEAAEGQAVVDQQVTVGQIQNRYRSRKALCEGFTGAQVDFRMARQMARRRRLPFEKPEPLETFTATKACQGSLASRPRFSVLRWSWSRAK